MTINYINPYCIYRIGIISVDGFDNYIWEVCKMPSLTIYVRKNIYKKLLLECEKLQIGESELINKILEVYFNAKEEKDLPASARQLPD